MKRFLTFLVLPAAAVVVLLAQQEPAPGGAKGGPKQGAPKQPAVRPNVTVQNAPKIRADYDYNFLKLNYEMNLGEVLGVAVNSKGTVVVLNHPGSSTTGPVYGNATTQLWEFNSSGKFIRELGKGVYGLAYAHSVRFDKYDNLWVVDKAAHTAIKFNPEGMVLMNLGRRPEGPDEPEFYNAAKLAQNPPRASDGWFNGATDVTWDAQDNIYVSDGYGNSRIAKFDKNGNWIKSFGSHGNGEGQLNLPHNIAADRDGFLYVADRSNSRIQVFDSEGNYQRMIYLAVPYDKTHHPVLGNPSPNPPDYSAAWAVCMTNTTPQYLYASDQEPGRIYKINPKDGKILGWFGELSGHGPGQFSWVHGIACPSENSLLVADMNNWRVAKVTLHPESASSGGGR